MTDDSRRTSDDGKEPTQSHQTHPLRPGRKLLGHLYELAVEVTADADSVVGAARAARELVAALDALHPDDHHKVIAPLRAYIFNVYDGFAATRPPPPEPPTAAAHAARKEIGRRTRTIVCARADVLRREQPGITMRAASKIIAPSIPHDERKAYDIIRRAFAGVWSDPDSAWAE